MREMNSYYQGLIQNLYGGKNGCFVAFMQFFYIYISISDVQQKLVYEKLYKQQLKNCINVASILQRSHLDVKYMSSDLKYLSGRDIFYLYDVNLVKKFCVEKVETLITELKSTYEKIDLLDIKEKIKIILLKEKEILKIIKNT